MCICRHVMHAQPVPSPTMQPHAEQARSSKAAHLCEIYNACHSTQQLQWQHWRGRKSPPDCKQRQMCLLLPVHQAVQLTRPVGAELRPQYLFVLSLTGCWEHGTSAGVALACSAACSSAPCASCIEAYRPFGCRRADMSLQHLNQQRVRLQQQALQAASLHLQLSPAPCQWLHALQKCSRLDRSPCRRVSCKPSAACDVCSSIAD